MLLSSGGEQHRTGFVWRSPSECKALKMRQRSSSLHWSPRYERFFEGCRLIGVCRVLGHTPSPDERHVTEICEQWLGVAPPPSAIQGMTVRVSWVKRLFDRLPDGAPAEVVTFNARAFTGVLVAGVLLADRNGDHIQVHILQLIGD
ncbi:hypothetical protein LINPERHAP2_LOCUS26069 [Linum perenne]